MNIRGFRSEDLGQKIQGLSQRQGLDKDKDSEGQLCPSATLARLGPMLRCLEYQQDSWMCKTVNGASISMFVNIIIIIIIIMNGIYRGRGLHSAVFLPPQHLPRHVHLLRPLRIIPGLHVS
jgi:hypothetical protein